MWCWGAQFPTLWKNHTQSCDAKLHLFRPLPCPSTAAKSYNMVARLFPVASAAVGFLVVFFLADSPRKYNSIRNFLVISGELVRLGYLFERQFSHIIVTDLSCCSLCFTVIQLWHTERQERAEQLVQNSNNKVLGLIHVCFNTWIIITSDFHSVLKQWVN